MLSDLIRAVGSTAVKLMVVIAVPLNAESNISEVGSEVMNNPSGVAAAAAEWLRAISLRNLVFLIVVFFFFFFPPHYFCLATTRMERVKCSQV